jgi:acyl-CoA thioester hydrolase
LTESVAVEGFQHRTDVRVRFAETDAQGVVHHANYLVWFELARVEFLERFAGGYQRLRDQGIESLLVEAKVRFISPARFDDRLVVHSRCLDVRGARFKFEYAVERDGTVLAEGYTAHGTVDAATMRPTRTPKWLVDAIAARVAPGSAAASES